MIANIIFSAITLFAVTCGVIYFILFISQVPAVTKNEKFDIKAAIGYSIAMSFLFTVIITIISIQVDANLPLKRI